MIINKKYIYTYLLALLLLSQLYVNNFKFNIFLQIITFVLIIYIDKITINTLFIKRVIPLLALFFIPFLCVFDDHQLNDIFKDISYFLKPIIGVLLGYIIAFKIKDITLFVKTIIYTGLISALIHVFVLLFISNVFAGNVPQIRQYGTDNFLELVALFFLIYAKKLNLSLSIYKPKIVFCLLLVSSVFYLSRTMFVVAFLLFISIEGFTKFTTRSIRTIGISTFFLLLAYTFLLNTKIDRNETGLMGFLYKIKIAPGEIFNAKIDRYNHANLWDNWRAYEAKRSFELIKEKPTNFFVGCGYGSLVNLKFHVPLIDESKGIKKISILHNGYAFVFYKSGLIGFFLMIFFLLQLFYFCYKKTTFENLFISALALTFLFTTVTITGVFNKRDILILILGALLFFSQKQTANHK